MDSKVFETMLLSAIEQANTEPEINQVAETLRNTDMFPKLTDEEFENALDLAIRTIDISFGESYSIEEDEKHRPWFQKYYKDLGVTRWERYKDYLKNQRHFAPAVVQSMQENLFKITDLLGNPNGDNFRRKGLIVGDVQSGKTANYIGLMNLATDAKYKLMIVLTGMTNTLREQTQIRIEEGMGNSDEDKGVSGIKNADYDKFFNPVYLTSSESDFNVSSRRNFQGSIESTNVPIVIVTKKNVSALRNIYNWLEEFSKKKNDNMIDSSLLLIDDEADFASVNTKKGEDNPTAINSKIRDILNLFTKSSYIGFTATPFANIFIDPETDDDMFGQDLFPKDYIYVLGESSEYVGVQSVFSDNEEVAVNKKMLVHLREDEVETYLQLKHKKDSLFTTLAPSMKDAINLFLIGNVIRDFRGDTTSHRSMLFNVSRFVDMHNQIKIVVSDYLDKVQRDVRLFGKLPLNEALKHPYLESIKGSFDKYYTDIKEGYSFEKILSNMNDSIYRIHVAVVNANNKGVDYIGNDDEGERVIVIGGFALSRGLTLEGLMISYYWRNSVMYDSLLQMGRWFGYRNGYRDLCKIFMSYDVIDDFKFIAMATQELKEDLDMNSRKGLTPKEFGIKVRSGQVGLIITARNKMRTGEKVTARVNFSKDVVETIAYSVINQSHNDKNRQLIIDFVENHKDKISIHLNPNDKNEVKGLIDVPKTYVINFLKDFIAEPGSRFDTSLIIKWLRENDDELLDEWDFAFMKGELKSTDRYFDYGNNIFGQSSLKSFFVPYNSKGIVKNVKSRVASPGEGRIGLDPSQLKKVNSWFPKGTRIPQKDYFDNRLQRKPIILIYSVFPKTEDGIPFQSEIESLEKPIPLLSIGIPELGIGRSKYVNYTVNKIYQEMEAETEEE
jgi:hypothetical protein